MTSILNKDLKFYILKLLVKYFDLMVGMSISKFTRFMMFVGWNGEAYKL